MTEMNSREFSAKVMGWPDGDYALVVHGKAVRWVRVSRTPFDAPSPVLLDVQAPSPSSPLGKATVEVPVAGRPCRVDAGTAALLDAARGRDKDGPAEGLEPAPEVPDPYHGMTRARWRNMQPDTRKSWRELHCPELDDQDKFNEWLEGMPK